MWGCGWCGGCGWWCGDAVGVVMRWLGVVMVRRWCGNEVVWWYGIGENRMRCG